MPALLIDLDGVIYDGDQPIHGAAETVAWVREQDIPHLFLTNTTSRSRNALVDKLGRADIRVGADRILTPPVAAARWLVEHRAGPAALFVSPETIEDFAGLDVAADDQGDVGAVVIGDYGERWTFDELNRAFRLLMSDTRPVLVALGMTRYWKAEDGLRLDTAPFVMALSHASGTEPIVIGKPARPFFETALSIIGTSAEETVMVGDDIKGDVGGAQAAGLTAALVRTGKFRPDDLDGDIAPDVMLDSIADLPEHWAKISGG